MGVWGQADPVFEGVTLHVQTGQKGPVSWRDLKHLSELVWDGRVLEMGEEWCIHYQSC